jgi:hypothetical protein
MAGRVFAAIALVCLAAALTACGVRNAVDPVAAAATKSQDAGGYRAKLSIVVSAAGRQMAMSGQGTFGPGEGELTIDLTDVLRQAGAPTGSDASASVIEVTEDGDPVIYVKLGALSSFLPGGKDWVRLDLAKAGKAAGFDLGRLLSAGQNPSQSLELLRSSGTFSEVGKENVDGVEATHYHGTVDLKKAAAASGVTGKSVERLLDQGAPAEVPVDVWVDDSGYVRRYQTSYEQSDGGRTSSLGLTIDLSDYGTPVEISAPPADQVFDATGLASSGFGSATTTS